MFEKFKEYWNKYDKTIHCMDGIAYSLIIGCNIWVITRDLPPAEIAFWWALMNAIGVFIGLSIVRPILLTTVFKERMKTFADNIINEMRAEYKKLQEKKEDKQNESDKEIKR